MAWQDYIDVDLIALNSRHVSGALASILGFTLLKWVSERVVDVWWLLTLIRWADYIVVASCIIYLTVVIVWAIVGKLRKVISGEGNALFALVA
jgi:hypothetical protein